MTLANYLKRRGGAYCIRVRVPVDLVDRLQKTEIVKALGTSDPVAAKRLVVAELQRVNALFDRLRSGRKLTSDDIEAELRTVMRDLLDDMQRRRIGGAIQARQGEGDDPYAEELKEDAADYWQDFQEGGFGRVERQAYEITERLGVGVDQSVSADREMFAELCRGLLYVNAEARYVEGRRHAGELSAAPAFPLNPTLRDPVEPTQRRQDAPPLRPRLGTAANGSGFSDVSARFLEELKRDKDARLTAQTMGQYEAVFRLFGQYVDNAPLSAITRATASEFLEKVATLDPKWGRAPGTKKLTVWEVLDKCGAHPIGLTNKTLNRYANNLATVFTWAKRRGVINGGDNPFTEQSRPKPNYRKTKWLPFTDDELVKLFGARLLTEATWEDRVRPKRHTTNSAMMWVPLIALFSGLRQNEICQLRTEDVRRDSDTGIWFFDIRDGEGRSVKTLAAIRRVPVHSTLVQCGFLEYVAALPSETAQVFPGLRPGGPDRKMNWYFSGRFTEYRKAVGVVRERAVFHSFRDNVGTALERAGVSGNAIDQFIGHEKKSLAFTVYSEGLELPALREVVEKVTYPALDLTGLHRQAA